MSPPEDWSGEDRRAQRRRILERRREERQDERDRKADEAVRSGEQLAPGEMRKRGPDRRKNNTERRISQICFVCHGEFIPKVSGQTVCEPCTLDGVRGGGRNGHYRS
jgi:hypothetical protein